MRCPLCEVSMKEVERRGVRIDVCPECKGVWLDRGELEKLLATAAAHEEEGWSPDYHDYHEHHHLHGGHDRYHDHHGHKDLEHKVKDLLKGKKKRHGFLGELFDIFD